MVLVGGLGGRRRGHRLWRRACDGASAVRVPLYEVPAAVETRWASPENPTGGRSQAGQAGGGRKGAPTITLHAGQRVVLAEARATRGTIRRIWMTFLDPAITAGVPCCSPRTLRSLRLDIYWDGAARPAVSTPLGDFFGLGLGQAAAFESALFSSPEGRSLNSVVPMPFRTGMRIELTNEGNVDVPALYYDVAYTIGDRHAAGTGYLHAYWHRERPTQPTHDYEILPRITGRGRYLGASVGVIVDKAQFFDTWWGEGEVKIYLDGDLTFPTMAGTGTGRLRGNRFRLPGPFRPPISRRPPRRRPGRPLHVLPVPRSRPRLLPARGPSHHSADRVPLGRRRS